jgi:hypothetical protein
MIKKIQILAVLGLTFVLGGVANAETHAKAAALTVVSVQGEARYSTDGSTWHPLVIGKILRAGTVIETAVASSCDLVVSGSPVTFPEDTSAPQSLSMLSAAPDPLVRGYESYKPMAQQNVIRVSADSMLAIDKLTTFDTGVDTVGDTELDLRAGKVFVNVKKMSADSQYIIKLPNGVAGIRGSCGSLSADGTVDWFRGLIVLSLIGPDGRPHVVTVHGGYSFDPSTGQISHLSAQLESVLRAFGYAAETLYTQVVVISKDLSLIYISPTQGRKTVGNGNNNGGGNNNNGGGEE